MRQVAGASSTEIQKAQGRKRREGREVENCIERKSGEMFGVKVEIGMSTKVSFKIKVILWTRNRSGIGIVISRYSP